MDIELLIEDQVKPLIPTELPANGGNSDTVGGFSIVKLTQSEYDALEVKDSSTIYLVVAEVQSNE